MQESLLPELFPTRSSPRNAATTHPAKPTSTCLAPPNPEAVRARFDRALYRRATRLLLTRPGPKSSSRCTSRDLRQSLRS
jgi:hypothetical protein